MAALFEERYPNIAAWVQDGWIEIGHDSNTGSFIRVLDEGGLVWESDKPYTSIDQALVDAEQAIAEWLDSQAPLKTCVLSPSSRHAKRSNDPSDE